MKKRTRIQLSLSLLLLIFISGIYFESFGQRRRPAAPPPPPPQLIVFALDIGQGDSELIVSQTGKIVLIDSGNPGNQDTIIAAIRKFTGPQCRIDIFIASHPHADHIGSARAIINQCQIATVLDSNFPATTPTYERYLKAVQDSGARYVVAKPDQTFDIGGGAVLTVLAPSQPFFKNADLRAGADEPNANSVVVRLDHGNFSILFTGDAEAETEARLIARGANLRAKGLKVGHHGSMYATSEEFLRAVRPEAATISASMSNRYGHPSQEALDRLRNAGINVYRTDLQGQIVITSNGRTYQIRATRAAPQRAIFTGRRPPRR